jgi:hypothetical protein
MSSERQSRKRKNKKGLEIRSLVGGPADRHEHVPPELVDFRNVKLTIGRAGEEEEVKFRVTIATPAALRARATGDVTVLAHRALLVVRELDWRAIRRHIEQILQRCDAPTLHDSIRLLERYFVVPHDDPSL